MSRLKANGFKTLLFGTLVYSQWYIVARFLLSINLIARMRYFKKSNNLIDLEQNAASNYFKILNNTRAKLLKKDPSKEEEIDEMIKKQYKPRATYQQMVENVYLSESGDELTVTMFPHGGESKHVYFLNVRETEYARLEGVESQDMCISDGTNHLQVAFDANLKPAKVSEGLAVLAREG